MNKLSSSLILLAVVSFGLAQGGTANAQDKGTKDIKRLVPDGPKAETGISGVAGYGELVEPPVPGFLHAITGRERSDAPCDFSTAFWHEVVENGAAVLKPEMRRISGCAGTATTGTNGSEQTARVPFGNAVQTNGDHRAIRGVQVCLNRQGDRLKGLRVFGVTLKPDGSVIPDAALNGEYKRPNCKEPWKPAVMCEAGKVVTGVTYQQVREAGSATEARGISLTCQGVKVETTSVPVVNTKLAPSTRSVR